MQGLLLNRVPCVLQVLTHKQLQARIERWVAGRGLIPAEKEGPSCDAIDPRLCQDLADSTCAVAAPAGSAAPAVAAMPAATGAPAIDPSALDKQVQDSDVRMTLLGTGSSLSSMHATSNAWCGHAGRGCAHPWRALASWQPTGQVGRQHVAGLLLPQGALKRHAGPAHPLQEQVSAGDALSLSTPCQRLSEA